MGTGNGPRSPAKPKVTAGAALALALTVYGIAAKRRTRNQAVPRPASPRQAAGNASGNWRGIAARVARAISRKNLTFIAAGAAFDTFFAILAGIAVLVSLSILILGTNPANGRLGMVEHLIPNYALKLLSDPHSRQTLGIGLLVSVAIDIWKVRAGSSCMLTALMLVHGGTDKRSFIKRQMTILALALIMVPFGLISLVLIAVLPGVMDSLPLSWVAKTAISAIRWPILIALFMTVLAAMYHYSRQGAERRWQWTSLGSVVAMVLWGAGSAGFSFYIREFLPYDESYGALGMVMILLGWLNFTAFIILLGAQINAEVEQERRASSSNEARE